jgi:hypothetical protein
MVVSQACDAIIAHTGNRVQEGAAAFVEEFEAVESKCVGGSTLCQQLEWCAAARGSCVIDLKQLQAAQVTRALCVKCRAALLISLIDIVLPYAHKRMGHADVHKCTRF